MNIIIFGASGATGRHLVQQALGQNHQVTAFVRSPAKLSMEHPLLRVIQGDVGDLKAVSQAVKGQEAVVSALGARHMFKLDQVLIGGMANIIKAMMLHKVRRLVYLSTLGVKESRVDAGFMIRTLAPTLLRTEIKGHELREEMVRKSGLDWQIVRAPILTNGPLTNVYQSGEDLVASSIAPSLSRADVASFMLDQLADLRYLCKPVRLMPETRLSIQPIL